MSSHDSNARPAPDQVLTDIADYVIDYQITSPETYRAARYFVMDALGCAMEALNFPECTKLLGPAVPGTIVPRGARVPGTSFELDPMTAAFNLGTMIRWLDFNEVFSGVLDGGHPSDNLGAILATADYLSRKRVAEDRPALVMREVLTAMVKSCEIHGIMALDNSTSRFGVDNMTMARVAATAVVTHMMGGSREEIINAVSNAWADGAALRVYRQGANTGTRKSWAGGDAASRAVWLGAMALKGEMGYPSALTAKTYGFYDAIFRGEPLQFRRPYGATMLESVIFKFIAAGLHGQSAAECAFRLHPLVRDRLEDIESISIKTHRSLLGIMDKQGPLSNPADRDHCAQYVIAVALIHGKLDTSDYEDDFAADPRIDRLRAKMTVVEDPRYTRDRVDPAKQSNAISIEVRFKDGSSAPKVEVEYPLGHVRRRAEALPSLEAKFRKHLARRFPQKQQAAILEICLDQARLEATPVNEFVDRFVI